MEKLREEMSEIKEDIKEGKERRRQLGENVYWGHC